MGRENRDIPRYSLDAGHEVRDAHAWAIIGVGAGLFIAIAALLVVLAVAVLPLDESLRATQSEMDNAAEAVAPWTHLEALRLERRALSERRLSGEGPIKGDPAHGRIPIDDAMRLMVEQSQSQRAGAPPGRTP